MWGRILNKADQKSDILCPISTQGGVRVTDIGISPKIRSPTNLLMDVGWFFFEVRRDLVYKNVFSCHPYCSDAKIEFEMTLGEQLFLQQLYCQIVLYSVKTLKS